MQERRVSTGVVLAMVGWLLLHMLEGASGLERAMGLRLFASEALRDGMAAVVLLLWAAWKRESLPGKRVLALLVVLALVSLFGEVLWRPYIDEVLHVHYAHAATQGMIVLAAPMWVALMGVGGAIPDETPRSTVGAVMAALAAYCLLLSEDDLRVRWVETPALLLTLGQVLALVWVWSSLKRSVGQCSVVGLAGCGLLLQAVVHAAGALLLPAPDAIEFAWHEVWMPLAGAAACAGLGSVLWFWLLRRLELGAFAMQIELVWLGSVLTVFAMFGFLSWRVDLALLLGVAAWITALRARAVDEEPVRLGVHYSPPR